MRNDLRRKGKYVYFLINEKINQLTPYWKTIYHSDLSFVKSVMFFKNLNIFKKSTLYRSIFLNLFLNCMFMILIIQSNRIH